MLLMSILGLYIKQYRFIKAVFTNIIIKQMNHTLLAFILFLASCSPIMVIDKSDFSQIPKKSSKVIANVNYSPDSLFNESARILARNGCPVQSDRTAMQIIGGNKSVEGGTMMNCMVYIEPTATGSRATITGEWGLDQDGQIAMKAITGSNSYGMSKIIFEGTGTTKPDVAFQYLVKYAKQIPSALINYGN